MEEEYKIDFIDMLLIELENRINIDPENEMLHKIKIYMESHKGRCLDYLYTNSKYKESALILTHIFKNIFTDISKDITEVMIK